MIDRRQVLRMAGVMAASAAGPAGRAGAATASRGPAIGVQLHMLRDLLAKDVEDTLAAVARIGIRYVEFAGYYVAPPRNGAICSRPMA